MPVAGEDRGEIQTMEGLQQREKQGNYGHLKNENRLNKSPSYTDMILQYGMYTFFNPVST